jgi:hypothetical protein
MLRRVALVITDVSEELSASFVRMTIIGELGTTLSFSETLVLTIDTRRNIPEDTILQILIMLEQWYSAVLVPAPTSVTASVV